MTKWGEKNGIEFWTMPPERAEEALDVLRNGFFDDEAFCGVVGVKADEAAQRELEALAVDCAKDGISIMAIDKATKKIVGVMYNKYQMALPPGQKSFFEEFRDTKCKTKSAVDLINEMIWFDSLVNLYEKYNADCSVELMFLGTHKDFRKKGIAVGCVEASLAMARSLPSPTCAKRPPIATAIFTSPYSIRTGRILQFEEVIHVPMQDKYFEGKRFCDYPCVGEGHPGSIVMVKRL